MVVFRTLQIFVNNTDFLSHKFCLFVTPNSICKIYATGLTPAPRLNKYEERAFDMLIKGGSIKLDKIQKREKTKKPKKIFS